MLNLGGKNLLLGGFHDHWSRAGGKNTALLLAALNYYHYDFMTLMDGGDEVHQLAARELSNSIRLYPGREDCFGWGHVVTVNPRAPRLPSDDGDYRTSLRRLKETCDLLILAHPEYPGTWEKLFLTGEMDRLLDEGLLDGINLINSAGFDVPRLRELIAWFNQRDAEGKLTPIVNGWDVHLLLPRRNLPSVLYSEAQPPKGHLDTGGMNRTILFCEENSLLAIAQAVKAGQTVIEDLATGELVGPRELIQFLRDHEYSRAIEQLDERRDRFQLTIASPWSGSDDSSFQINAEGACKVALPSPEGLRCGVLHPAECTANGKVTVEWTAVPDNVNHDYAAVVFQAQSGEERIWAVETAHPVQLELLPASRGTTPGVELRALRPFSGTVSIHIPDLLKWSGTFADRSLFLPLSRSLEGNYIRKAQWEARSTDGLVRAEEADLTFITAAWFPGHWDSVPEYAVAEERFAPRFGYGSSRSYPGKDVFAAYLQFAWDQNAFYLRARVTDPMHHQPAKGHYVYNADCLQLAFDPVLRRGSSIGNIYSFNLALTPEGPELYRWLAPTEEEFPGVAPANDVSLGNRYLAIESMADGLIYNLTLPWTELSPARAEPGGRMGIYLIGMNNNGEGLLDTLHWPLPLRGMWTTPNRWGVLILE